jgi:hypothetical protein
MVFKTGDMVTLDYAAYAAHRPDEVTSVKNIYGDAVFEITNTPNYSEPGYRLKVVQGGADVFGSACKCGGAFLKAFTEEKAPTVSGESVMSITRKMFR